MKTAWAFAAAAVLLVVIGAFFFLAIPEPDFGSESSGPVAVTSAAPGPLAEGSGVATPLDPAAAASSKKKRQTKASAKTSAGGNAANDLKTEPVLPAPSLPANATAPAPAAGAPAPKPAGNPNDKQSEKRAAISSEVMEGMNKWREKHLASASGNGGKDLLKSDRGNPRSLADRGILDVEKLDPALAASGNAASPLDLVEFSAVLLNRLGQPFPGVRIYATTAPVTPYIPPVGIIAGASVAELPPGALIVGASDREGRVVMGLPASVEAVSLVAVLDPAYEVIFNGPISRQSAWRNQVVRLNLEAPTALVSGRVLDRWGHPLPGAVVTTREIQSLAEHVKILLDKSYRFALSDAKGEFVFALQAPWVGGTLTCLVGGAEPQKAALPPLAEGEVQTDIVFSFTKAGPEPGLWRGRFLAPDNSPLVQIAVSLRSFPSVEEALSSGAVLFSDGEGRVELVGVEPGVALKLWLYHARTGALVLDEHKFSSGEVYEKEYRPNVSGDEPGQLGLRLQGADGIDVRSGWIATTSVHSPQEFQALVQQGGSGAEVRAGLETWVQNLSAWRATDLYYANDVGGDVLLGSYTLKSGEKRNLGLVRLQQGVVLPSELAGSVVDQDGRPVPSLLVEARYGNGDLAASATTAQDGTFALKPLAQQRLLRVVAAGVREKQVLKDNLVLSGPYSGGEVFLWQSLKPFSVAVRAGNADKPVTGARVSIIGGGQNLSQITGEDGKAEFAGLKVDTAFHLEIFHTFYNNLEQRDFLPDFAVGTAAFEVVPRPGVRVRLNGPDWSQGLFVRSWVGVASGNIIMPDRMPGNEYAEVLKQPELLFLTPPDSKFWIYTGGMPPPWGARLHGPFTAKADDVIDLTLEQVKPVKVTLAMEKRPPWWSLGIYAIGDETSSRGQLVSAQSMGIYEGEYYLGNGPYLATAESQGYRIAEVPFNLSGNAATALDLQLEKLGDLPPAGGYVMSYLVSDKFPLVLSKENFHHGEQCYGFNKDWLAHLGGEATFAAAHLGEYPPLEGENPITWRRMDFADGVLDFKKLYPAGASDYSVVYAQFRIECSEARNLLMGCGSDDGIKAWVNSELVLFFHQPRPLYAEDQNTVPVSLRSGINQINFKVDNSWGDWKLRVRFLDPQTKAPITELKLDPPGGLSAVAPP